MYISVKAIQRVLPLRVFSTFDLLNTDDRMKPEGKQIGYYLERTTRKVKLRFTKAFSENDIDLTPEQWVIIDRLYKNNGQSQTELAEDSYKNAPTISRILDVLERKNYIERQRFVNDRRRYKIFLTNLGQRIAAKALPLALELREKGWDGLTDAEYDLMIRLLNKVFANYDFE